MMPFSFLLSTRHVQCVSVPYCTAGTAQVLLRGGGVVVTVIEQARWEQAHGVISPGRGGTVRERVESFLWHSAPREGNHEPCRLIEARVFAQES